jgi:hypothetical protein
VRELHDHEAEALDQAVRSDYEPWFSFARATGLRLRETLITWPQVNWQAGQIVTRGKGGKIVTTPITATVRAILEPLKGHHPEYARGGRYVQARAHWRSASGYPPLR